MMHKFCVELEKLMKSPNYLTYTIFHYTTLNPHKRANAAFLMGAYQVVVMGRTAVDAWKPFTYVSTFTPFRDASFGGSNFQLPILNCLRGLEKAIELGWYDYRTFNVQEYEYYERVENGDFNWILPKKLLAFSCPSPTPTDAEGWRTFTPEDYSQLFKKIGTTAVVRLNKVTYEADVRNM
jgi:cell division cycle 14